MSIRFVPARSIQSTNFSSPQELETLLEVPCLRGLNLLGHAQLENFLIGSQCGGHGICGRDRIFIPKGEWSKLSPPTSIEQTHLKTEEIQAGWRLACQCFPASDDLEVIVGVVLGLRSRD